MGEENVAMHAAKYFDDDGREVQLAIVDLLIQCHRASNLWVRNGTDRASSGSDGPGSKGELSGRCRGDCEIDIETFRRC